MENFFGTLKTECLYRRRFSCRTEVEQAVAADVQADIGTANDLFLGESYSRMLLSVDLPKESGDTTAFVKQLSAEAKTVFTSGMILTVCGFAMRLSMKKKKLGRPV